MTTRRSSSILEILHPDGFVDDVLVLGSELPATLEPAPSPAPSTSRFGLAIVAPDAAELGSLTFAGAVAGLEERLTADGLVYAIGRPRHRARLRRLLIRAGFEPELDLVHLPEVSGTRHLVPLARAPLQHLAAALTSGRQWERAAVELLARLPASVAHRVAPVGLVARRSGGRPLLAWLRELAAGHGEIASFTLSRSWHTGHGGVVVACFGPADRAPWGLAKLRDGAKGNEVTLAEADTLATMGPDAVAAGATVPRRLAVRRVGPREVLLEDAVPGRVAATALHTSPRMLDTLLERLALWLSAWHERTAVDVELTRDELERRLLRPAESLAGRVASGDRYLTWLAARCGLVEGTPLRRVAVHHDLTMWNVLVERGGLGVVDWEGAEPAGWPLGDFVYAAVDAVAATRGYRDRPAAFEQCFAPGGRHRELVARLHGNLSRALGLDDEQATVCFHACWLRHALDARRTDEADRSPFLAIADALIESTVPRLEPPA